MRGEARSRKIEARRSQDNGHYHLIRIWGYMSLHVVWPDPHINEFISPFLRGKKERPLRLSIHTQSLCDLTEEEDAAYKTIRELGQLKDVDVVATENDVFPYYRVQPVHDLDGFFNIEVIEGDSLRSLHLGIHSTCIDNSRIYTLAHTFDQDDPGFLAARNDITAVEAHSALQRDIFVTASPLLLCERNRFQHANIRSPLEAVKIVGLFLRSRDNWTYSKVGKATCKTDSGLFYWVLARTNLPAMWRYFSGCVYAQQFLGENILHIGQSVLVRCTRALQARDAIGTQFYLLQDNTTRDTMMYHFDYLTLLLAGIFDAQANIVNIAYHLVDRDVNISFRNRDFLRALRGNSTRHISKIVTSNRCKQLMKMLHSLRNTIHNAGLSMYASNTLAGQQMSLVKVPESIQDDLWQASTALSTPEEWGIARKEFLSYDSQVGCLVPQKEVSIEPYTYASQLLREWFGLINDIASATEVERLFVGRDVPELSTQPPAEWHSCMHRFKVLG